MEPAKRDEPSPVSNLSPGRERISTAARKLHKNPELLQSAFHVFAQRRQIVRSCKSVAVIECPFPHGWLTTVGGSASLPRRRWFAVFPSRQAAQLWPISPRRPLRRLRSGKHLSRQNRRLLLSWRHWPTGCSTDQQIGISAVIFTLALTCGSLLVNLATLKQERKPCWQASSCWPPSSPPSRNSTSLR